MSNPLVHAERSAKKWGGTPADYLAVHQWFDATKSHQPDNRHRMILHNGFGIALAEQVFGAAITNADGKRVFLRAGFTYEGARRAAYDRHGDWQDGARFGLLSHELTDV